MRDLQDVKILLLNNGYEAISFINVKKALKLVLKDKVDVVSEWGNSDIHYSNGTFVVPAILRLKGQIKRRCFSFAFSRRNVVRRDNGTCQYCGVRLTSNEITIDHIVPRSHGGETSYLNCVVSCKFCNSYKGSRSLDQLPFKLLKKPTIPQFVYIDYFTLLKSNCWHDDWNIYLSHILTEIDS